MKITCRTGLAFFGFRRGGSSIAFMILQHLLLNSGLKAQDIVAFYHNQGTKVDDIPVSALEESFAANHLVGCFRKKPYMLDQLKIDFIRPILLIRDPRDCQLSWFSARHLHTSGPLNVTLTNNVELHLDLIENETFHDDIYELLALNKAWKGLILRYEDMVLNPLAFLNQFISFAKLSITQDALDQALIMSNFVQLIHDERNHNRSGAPFQALRTLPLHILDKMNERFGNLVLDMGYPLFPEDIHDLNLNSFGERDAQKRFMMKLAEQNGMRIKEISGLRETLSAQESDISRLKQVDALRTEEIRQIRLMLAELSNKHSA